MTTESDYKHDQYIHERTSTIRENSNDNEKKPTNDITNRRHSLAHSNFRKAIYRSLSLPQANDESNSFLIYFIKTFLKLIFICIFLLLIGSLVKLMWSSHRRH